MEKQKSREAGKGRKAGTQKSKIHIPGKENKSQSKGNP
jgi:hypothetical protein